MSRTGTPVFLITTAMALLLAADAAAEEMTSATGQWKHEPEGGIAPLRDVSA